MRRRLFGDDDGATAALRTINTEASYGAIWSRPGLALDDRMICALAALAAVQRLPKLRRHVGAALELGLTPRAIVEVLIQIGIYAGFAASEEAVDAAAAIGSADAVLVPALAVANDGTRLGRGGGSYDRALARVPVGTPVWVLLYDDEVGVSVPVEPHDRLVTGAATPSGIVRLRQTF